jgi:hypothetical protein
MRLACNVGDKAKCRLFSCRQGKFGDMDSCVSAHFCVVFSRHYGPRTDDIWSSVVLIPTFSGNLHNRSPQQQTAQKNHPPPPSPCLRLHLLPRRRLTLHPLCLFVRPFVGSFGWLLRCLSAPCCHVPSRSSPRHVVPLRLVSRRRRCRVVASSRRRIVASRLALSLYPAP